MTQTASSQIAPFDLPRLARQTFQASRRTYRRKPRALSVIRLASLIRPNLQSPIFIVGSPRSGTTFLGDCLACLPEVSYHFEPVATKFASRWVYQNLWSYEKAHFFYAAVYSWLMRLHLDADLRFSEKTPINCFLIPFLHKTFPDAVFIHLLRDGRDVALSYSRKPWLQEAYVDSGKREPGGYPFGTAARFWVESDRVQEFETTTDIHRCIWAWRRHVEIAMESLAVLPPDQHCCVNYEHLVQTPIAVANQLLDFLGIDAPASRTLFYDTISEARCDSVGNWKHELTDKDLTLIEREAGALLCKLHYT